MTRASALTGLPTVTWPGETVARSDALAGSAPSGPLDVARANDTTAPPAPRPSVFVRAQGGDATAAPDADEPWARVRMQPRGYVRCLRDHLRSHVVLQALLEDLAGRIRE